MWVRPRAAPPILPPTSITRFSASRFAGAHHTVSQPALPLSGQQAHDAVLQDMRELEEVGERVIWPDSPPTNHSSSSADFPGSVEQPLDVPLIEACPSPSASSGSPPPPPEFNLQDLLDLDEAGEKVNWPTGFCPSSARAHLLALANRPSR